MCHRYIVENPGSKITKHNFSVVFSEAWVSALTQKNIVSGFRTTGIYPPNRNAITLPIDESENLATQSGVAYIPLYTPAKRRLSTSSTSLTIFTSAEMESYALQFEEGTGCETDARYQAWLTMYRPSGYDSPNCVGYLPAHRQSALCNILESPQPISRCAGSGKSSMRVLTSSENMRRIAEKEREKADKLKAKEERARKREQKQFQFSAEEIVKFTTRYENGYDITSDSRYNAWLTQRLTY